MLSTKILSAVAGTDVGTDSDLHFSNVSLLLHGDGTNGSTSIADSSVLNTSFTAYGDAKISTDQKKYGTGSLKFDGALGSIRSTVDDTNLWSLGTGDFTLEFWLYFVNAPSGWACVMQLATRTNNTFTSESNGFYVSAHVLAAALRVNSVTVIEFGDASAIPKNTWTHIAVTRESNVFRIFKNGVQGGSGTSSASISARKLVIGTDNMMTTSGQGRLTGYIDDIRITKGVARYTADFTPPTAPFPNQ